MMAPFSFLYGEFVIVKVFPLSYNLRNNIIWGSNDDEIYFVRDVDGNTISSNVKNNNIKSVLFRDELIQKISTIDYNQVNFDPTFVDANGEKYRKRLLTAAHRKLPFNTKVKVSNPKNGRWVIVRINDRGPYHKKRIIDLSERAARHLGIFGRGFSKVIIQEVPDSAQVWINQSQY